MEEISPLAAARAQSEAWQRAKRSREGIDPDASATARQQRHQVFDLSQLGRVGVANDAPVEGPAKRARGSMPWRDETYTKELGQIDVGINVTCHDCHNGKRITIGE